MSYDDVHRLSLAEPDRFWTEQARLIDWHQPFERVLDYSQPPFARWFVGGRTNLCHNAVDRHLATQRDQPALIYVSSEVDQEQVYTFAQLHAEVQRMAASLLELGARQGDRVLIYMSWGGSVRDIEDELEQCGIGKTPEERKTISREYFDIVKKALTQAMAGAPGILFVVAAGNSNSDASFTENAPADIVLPNLIKVGAVDRAGDEAPFTSYGPTVKVHANGYQVESYLPGGARVALSGTSMAAPQVTNVAAKLLAAKPSLTPPQLIDAITSTAERTTDGRRVLMNPKAALAKVTAGG